MNPHPSDRLHQRLHLSTRSLRSALRYFSVTLQAQNDLLARRRHELGMLAGEQAVRQAELVWQGAEIARQNAELAQRIAERDALGHVLARRNAEIAHRDAEIARRGSEMGLRDLEIARLARELAQAHARATRLRRAVRHPVRAARHVLRRLRQRLWPARPDLADFAYYVDHVDHALHEVGMAIEAAPEAHGAGKSASAPVLAVPSPVRDPVPPVPSNPMDYRERMRALIAGGLFAGLRTVAVVVPPTMREAGTAIEHCLAATGLHCTVGFTMPAQFTEALYLVVAPSAFTNLPPADRRIVWLVDAEDLANPARPDRLAHLAASLAIFDASLERIEALQQRGIALHQTFYVPLDPLDSADAALADDSPMGLRHLLPRALHGCGAIDDDAFEQATRGTRLDADHLVLCLPESLARFRHAQGSLRAGAMPFPGIRHLDGWKGTALSYRYLARRALAAGRVRLIVSEDDAEFVEDFEARLANALTYLDAHAGSWDLFSGLLTDLSEQAEVKAVDVHQGDLFLRLDSVIGMVFGIYGQRALEALAAYRFMGNDVMKDTIDRYLESLRPRCITLFPPLVRHDDGFSSTLWTPEGHRFVTNEYMTPVIHRSQVRILSKIGDHLERAVRAD